jgi:hypothetical protein
MKRTFNPEKASKATLIAASMPRLKHKIDDADFDIDQSEVVNWLVRQPEIRQSMFNHFKDLGAIIFDGESRTWRGVNFSV